jgi:hypothetical protein
MTLSRIVNMHWTVLIQQILSQYCSSLKLVENSWPWAKFHLQRRISSVHLSSLSSATFTLTESDIVVMPDKAGSSQWVCRSRAFRLDTFLVSFVINPYLVLDLGYRVLDSKESKEKGTWLVKVTCGVASACLRNLESAIHISHIPRMLELIVILG